MDLSVDEVLHAFGDYFVHYVQDNGYSNVLECLGNNLRDWLSNLNALHDHLKASYPKGFVAPVFWSEDDEEHAGALLVHYYSRRGSLLVPLVVGLIQKIAMVYFDIEIDMEMMQLQDEENAKHTSWRITAKEPTLSYKLRGDDGEEQSLENSQESLEETRSSRYGKVFREGEKQAADLRTEEFVKRCFYNPKSELFHALTGEHYAYLVQYWKSNKIDEKWCYDRWTMDENPAASTFPTLKDLPPDLNAMICPHLKNSPATGQYPPDECGNLQSFGKSPNENHANNTIPFILCPHMSRDENGDRQTQPPLTFTIRLENASTGLSTDLVLENREDISLDQAIRENAGKYLESWSPQDEESVQKQESVKQCIVWDHEMNDAYHSFSLEELKTTTTRQLLEMFPVECLSSDVPIELILQCTQVKPVEDDEEDI